MIREPTEIKIDEHGRIELPLGLLAEAGLSPGSSVMPSVKATGASCCVGPRMPRAI
ncbi:hypothetical protein ACFVOR_06465 [Streptomyces sp. NPDC057837]|uniref:hypothetical protein n=1 Tax=Streptomyces sp. NPDC057837 TaxID=3346260 RepID=UPI003679F5E8